MRYQPNILNEYGVFQRISSLLKAHGKDVKLAVKLEHFLYHASCILVSLKNMHSAEGSTVNLVREYLNQIDFDDSKRIAISADPLFHVYSQIPTCLTLLVILQNELIYIFQKIEGVGGDVPSSLNKAIKKGLTNYGFSESLNNDVINYWNNGGKYIRDLRDVNEHHVALVDNSYFQYKSYPGQILVLLPDNPGVKSINEFKYEEENDAYDVISSGLMSLNKLVDKALENADFPKEQFTHSMYMGHLGTFEKPQNRTLGLMISIESMKQSETGVELVLDTIELRQKIPEEEGGSNITVKKLKTDSELEKDSK